MYLLSACAFDVQS